MIKYTFDKTGTRLVRKEVATPTCGDFCDTCGECLYCWSHIPCFDNAEHYWVEYLDNECAIIYKPLTDYEMRRYEEIVSSWILYWIDCADHSLYAEAVRLIVDNPIS